MSNKDHNYTDDGSTLAEDEMKHSFLVRVWRFLEDHIAAILALFIPVWLGLLFVWAVVLRALEAANLLPSEKSHFLLTGAYQRSFRPGPMLRLMHFTPPLVMLVSLVIIAIIAILRMHRDVKDKKPILIYLLLIALDLIFMSFVLVCFNTL